MDITIGARKCKSKIATILFYGQKKLGQEILVLLLRQYCLMDRTIGPRNFNINFAAILFYGQNNWVRKIED